MAEEVEKAGRRTLSSGKSAKSNALKILGAVGRAHTSLVKLALGPGRRTTPEAELQQFSDDVK
jgi:hypothetical protein